MRREETLAVECHPCEESSSFIKESLEITRLLADAVVHTNARIASLPVINRQKSETENEFTLQTQSRPSAAFGHRRRMLYATVIWNYAKGLSRFWS